MKAHVVFVEGGHTPNHVHAAKWQAEKEGERLAKLNPGKEVMVLMVSKRLKATEDGIVENLGSHVPENLRPTVANLVEGRTIKHPPKKTTLRLKAGVIANARP